MYKEKYINPFTDYGFKRLFGEEPNKDLLLDFLNELLKDQEGKITEISYLPNEKLPISVGDRKAIFDIYCTNEKGEQFIVEMPKFNKTEKELKTRFEKWMFVLKNLPKLERIPTELKGQIFLKLFEIAEISKLKPEEYKQYEASMNAYRDVKNSIDTAFEKGEIKGIEKGKIEDAKKMLEKGLDIDLIVEITGLSKDRIRMLNDK